VPRLIWSPPALTDVQRLYRFLALKDEDAARRAIKTIRSGVKILAHQPEVGRPIEDMDPVFREWLMDLRVIKWVHRIAFVVIFWLYVSPFIA
jgi:plasmid stabilization system protein ParE